MLSVVERTWQQQSRAEEMIRVCAARARARGWLFRSSVRSRVRIGFGYWLFTRIPSNSRQPPDSHLATKQAASRSVRL